ncbi:hypothetical protein chiPu_0025149 [Chiloscyllium punctatum]|uniref:Uncharacterized protein n=1 Tax=Chiloscyllium punctatum TaxID=137246 RepID=A0A401TF65_CHIPU|nr:hypothetical protein [Chiloscyllium punctatum]
MLCWGSGASHQLGLKHQTSSELQEVECPRNRAVKAVCCGERHSVFLVDDGTVFTCGENEKGQLARQESGPPSIGKVSNWAGCRRRCKHSARPRYRSVPNPNRTLQLSQCATDWFAYCRSL